MTRKDLRMMRAVELATLAFLPMLALSCNGKWPGSLGNRSPGSEGPTPAEIAYSRIDLWNCNKNQQSLASGPHRPVSIYLSDTNSPPWQMPDPGPVTLQAQYNSGGLCPYDESGSYAKATELYLAPPASSGTHNIEVGVVDQDLIGCGGVNDPNTPSCLLEHFFVNGNKDGPVLNHIVGLSP